MAKKTKKDNKIIDNEKHPGGRPRKYQSVEQLQAAIDSYFNEREGEKVSVTGLALHLGFCSRQALINNEGYSPEFNDALKRAKLRVENYYEEHLIGQYASGPIFALKNFNWTDRQDLNINPGGRTTPEFLDGTRTTKEVALELHRRQAELGSGLYPQLDGKPFQTETQTIQASRTPNPDNPETDIYDENAFDY